MNQRIDKMKERKNGRKGRMEGLEWKDGRMEGWKDGEYALRITHYALRFTFHVSRLTLLVLWLSGFLAFEAFAQLLPEQMFKIEGSSCKVCHGKEKVAYTGSIHDQRGLTCTDCHGGDSTSLKQKQAMSPTAGFKGKPDKKGIVELCARCHSDERIMTPYGLPTNQFGQYRISVHGTRLFEHNDTNVAVCTNCHQTHETLSHTDPRSTTYIANVPKTCAKCHADAALMKPYGIPTNQYDKYVNSVHAKALLEQGNTAAPNCARCHGTHGAAPPGVADVSKVCGQCHNNTRDYFNQSPHKKAMEEQKLPECASCHSNHDIAIPTLALFDTSCGRCHETGTAAFRRGQEIKTLLVNATTALDAANQYVADAKHQGVHTAEYEFVLEEARTNLLRVIPVTHTMSLSTVKDFTEKSQGEADKVKLNIHNYFESLKIRKVALGLIWVFLFGTIVALFWRLRRADREWREKIED